MLLKKYSLLLFLLGPLMACNTPAKLTTNKNKPSFQPRLIGLVVHNIDASLNWYVDQLGFEIATPIQASTDNKSKITLLKTGDFYLELKENPNSYTYQQIPLPPDYALTGVHQLGFLVNEFDQLYQELKNSNKIKDLTPIQNLRVTDMGIAWPKRSFQLKDIDGNQLQFFTYDTPNKKTANLQPWYIKLIVKNLDEIQRWYIYNLGFEYQQTLGNWEQSSAYLTKENFVLELFKPANVFLYDALPSTIDYEGFRSIGFGTNALEVLYNDLQLSNTVIIKKPQLSDFNWAKRNMIFKDVEGNEVQVLERK